MGTYFLTSLRDILSDAGVTTKVTSVNEGWETRSRSSGGFNGPPLGIIAHHTASNTAPENDLNWMIHGSDDAPIGNMLLANDGVVWPIAAGASNCAGKGGPVVFSRGTVTKDSGNSMTWNIEAANSGVGEVWSVAQIDAYFAAINALNGHFGNIATDLETHQSYAPDRKIDPATAAAVQGSWRPASITSSGTWSLADFREECERRWPISIPPQPPNPSPIPLEEAMYIWRHTRYADQFAIGAGALHINATVSKRLSADGVPMIVESDDKMLDYVCQASGFPRGSVVPL